LIDSTLSIDGRKSEKIAVGILKKTKKIFVSFIKFNNFAALKNVGKY